MLTPVEGQIYPTDGSHKKLYFNCSCGRQNILITWRYFKDGTNKTCGKCGTLPASHWENTKYGKLRMKFPVDVHKSSGKIVTWVCDCGKESEIKVVYVTTGNTSSCGKCNILNAAHFENTKYGKLKLKVPKDMHPNSKEKLTWMCDCGKESEIPLCNVTLGKQKTCGKCNVLGISHWDITEYGKLKLKIPQDLHKGSDKIVTWVCNCGNETNVNVHEVTSGGTKSCGKCTIIKSSHWHDTKYGKLKLKVPKDLHKGSNQKVIWKCNCGNETNASIYYVANGRTTSCGSCFVYVKKRYEINKDIIINLKTPIHPDQIGIDPIYPLETVTNTGKPFKARCPACLSEYHPVWDNLRLGRALTCGCTTNRISVAQKEISEFIESLGLETKLEYTIGSLKYDICVPSKNLVIEYNGLKWHSMPLSKEQDIKKYQNSILNNYGHIMIFEDEWLLNKHKVQGLIRNRLWLNNPQSLRPSQCVVQLIKSFEADPFYDQFHYIGPCKAPINYGVFYQDNLIGCMSFKTPTRQSKHQWELVRIASDPKFRVHGVWSKIIKQFINDNHPKSIVSFSDNRLFPGTVYEKLGFKFDGEIRPDYYWVKGQKRFHKSTLRKKPNEQNCGTEYQLREAQGYERVYDLGKKRWVYY